MKQAQLLRYAALYRAAKQLCADQVLRDYLGLPDDFVLPLTVAHGVDFGQTVGAMDVRSPEPIYWACNPSQMRKAERVKPSLLMPHPFLLAAAQQVVPAGKGTLVIGPPPGPAHDCALREQLRGQEREATILVKPKQGYEKSLTYWRSEGFVAETLGSAGTISYTTMASTLGRYARIVSPTFSSAIFFAAALGKRIDLLSGFKLRAWETVDIEASFAWESAEARAIASVFLSDNQRLKQRVARELLGERVVMSPERLRLDLESKLENLNQPFHLSDPWPGPLRTIAQRLALKLNRPGLLSPSTLVRQIRPSTIVIMQELDEVTLWREGRSDYNPRLRRSRYVRHLTEPGDACQPYL